MNADLLGMWNYYNNPENAKNVKVKVKYGKNKLLPSLDGILITDDGHKIGDYDAREYLRWCLDNGYRDLYSAPDFDTVKDKLNMFY